MTQAAQPDWIDRKEADLLEAALRRVPRLGFTGKVIAASAAEAGLTPGEARLLTPGGGRDLAALLGAEHDRRALAILSAESSETLRIRERIAKAVTVRCDVAMDDEATTRRWVGFLLLPQNLALGARLLWATADALWRWAGDTSTDENHYSKRVLLGEILFSTLGLRLTVDGATAARHLSHRIDSVMAFERTKARLRAWRPTVGLAAGLGRLRYGG
jgi:ubiquinone biosynthesis protein COQ9